MVICGNFLSDSLSQRSSHGQLTKFLLMSTKQMVFSILTRKSQVPRLRSQLCPSEAQVLAKRRQVSTGGSHRARPPDPAQRSSLMQPSTQAPAGPQSPQAAHTVESGPARCSPGRRPLPSGHRGRDGERSTDA